MSKNPESRMGTAAWIATLGAVAVYEAVGSETMTHAFRRLPRALGLAALAVTNLHLMEMLPDRFDPFVKIGNLYTTVMEAIDDQIQLD